MKKALFLGIIVLLFTAITFAAPVEVEFWHAMGGAQGEAVQEIVDMFNSQNPDIVVKPVYIGNYGALNQKLLASVQSNTLPVLSQAYGNWTSKLLQSGVIQSLNDFIADPVNGLTAAEMDDIYAVFHKMVKWGDTYYALPFNKSIYVMYYNTDIFDLEGIEPPKTIDELVQVAKDLTVFDENGEVERYGIYIRPTVDTLSMFMLNEDAYIVEETEDGDYEVTINNEKTKKILEMLKGLKDNHYAMVEGGYENGPFGEEKVCFYLGTIASKSYVDSSSKGVHDWNWTALPSGKTFQPPFAGTDVIMFSSASDAEKEAGWKFMKFLVDPKVTTFWSMKTGYLPVRKSALETAEWKTYTKLDTKAAIPVQFIKNGYADPKPATWNEIRNTVGDMFANIMYDKWTIDEGLEWAEKEIYKYLSE
jgi:multiple sugar transport system substrate-binding protein